MFDRIARKYDLLNRVNSLGLDQGWRRKTVARVDPRPGERILDLATGTADLAIALAEHAADVHVVGIDPSENMLDIGRDKVRAHELEPRVTLVAGDAQALESADDAYDAMTMAFGIRNVPDRAKALEEMRRVLRPGGRLAILELSEPRTGLMAMLARVHVRHVVPLTGALISGPAEYRYLRESIRAFPPPEAFASVIADAGFVDVDFEPLTFGACVLFTAKAP
jgi:demethylmenaquinone methyltransferase/2-methoxy-6-polyprenyl-1,4-benzoquinol methylase